MSPLASVLRCRVTLRQRGFRTAIVKESAGLLAWMINDVWAVLDARVRLAARAGGGRARVRRTG